MSIVSENMKYLRKLHGWTQEQFSRKMGIKRASVGAYEEGRANPNLDVLKTMSKLFSVSVDDLLKKDLCKIRETPSLIPIDRPRVAPLIDEPKTPEPQSLASIFDQFYTPPTTTIKANAAPPVVTPVPAAIIPPVGEPPKINIPPAPVATYEPLAVKAPSFNNIYESDNGATVVQAPPSAIEKNDINIIGYVRKEQFQEYIEKFQRPDFIRRLPTFEFPILPTTTYRAFEATEDFAFMNAFLIGTFIGNWYDIVDGKSYIIIARNLGVVCRRVFNQVKIKGTLLLSSDKAGIPTFEIPLKDVLEAWEIKAFFSTSLPEPTVSLDHLRHLVNQMQDELNRIKK